MNSISVMSYNIWFDIAEREKRLISLFEIIKYYNPDVICLQEVIPETAEYLINKLENVYKYIYPKKIELSYGCMIFCRYEISQYIEYKYIKTLMGRKLHCVVICYDQKKNRNIVIATSHFESEFKKINEIKTRQYTEAQQILNDLSEIYGPVIFCSDTNILPDEEKYFFKNWLDAWQENGYDSLKEYTYDTKLNLNLKNRNIQKEIRSRIDRIIYKTNNVLNLISFELIKGFDVEPSDHYGIMADFEIVNNTIEI